MDKSYILLALMASVFSTISFLCTKHLLKNYFTNHLVFLFYFNLVMAVISPVVWLFTGKPGFPLTVIVPLSTASVLAFTGWVCMYTAFAKSDLSFAAPLLNLKVVFTALLSFLVLRELHGFAIYLSVILSVIGVTLLSRENGINRIRTASVIPPLILILLAVVCYSFADVMIKKCLDSLNIWSFAPWYFGIVAFLSLILLPFIPVKAEMKTGFKPASILVFSAALNLAAILTLFLSFQEGNNITIPNIIISLRGIFVILSLLLLSRLGVVSIESHTRKVYMYRLTGAVCLTIAVFFIMIS